MTTASARRVMIPAFRLTRLAEHIDVVAITCQGKDSSFAIGEVFDTCNNFAAIVSSDGSPWTHANIYLTTLIQNVTSSTICSIAADLRTFREFLDERGVDFLESPETISKRPTYAYKAYLRGKISSGDISINTANRKIGSLIRFYRWLKSEGVTFDNFLWKEQKISKSYKTEQGFEKLLILTKTDLTFRKRERNGEIYDLEIEDGGKLRPLSLFEQETIIDAIRELQNTEALLMHLVALFTGARLQTVCTLRISQIASHYKNHKNTDARIKIGPGTGTDTKNDKPMTLHLPWFLVEKIYIYFNSSRSQKRQDKHRSKASTSDPLLFLTNRGDPYYRPKDEKHEFKEDHKEAYLREGQAVGETIRKHIIPKCRKTLGDSFWYRFHDLRASFGMNLTDAQLLLVAAENITLSQARDFVRSRMGHTNYETTDRYLNYRKNFQLMHAIQSAHESHLEKIIEKANNHEYIQSAQT